MECGRNASFSPKPQEALRTCTPVLREALGQPVKKSGYPAGEISRGQVERDPEAQGERAKDPIVSAEPAFQKSPAKAPDVWVRHLGHPRPVVPQDDYSLSQCHAQQKNHSHWSSQPTESWENECHGCFNSLNFEVVCSTTISHKKLMFLYFVIINQASLNLFQLTFWFLWKKKSSKVDIH